MQVGLIGCGNMGRALYLGMVRTGRIRTSVLFNRSIAKAEALASLDDKARVATSAKDVLKGCELLILALEPQGILPCLRDLSDAILSENPLIISVAAGVTLAQMQACVPQARLIRLMPNTAVRIGEGASGFVCGPLVQAGDALLCQELMSQTGLCVELQAESDIEAVVALAGSAPAFFYELLDAMCKQGVASGLPADLALQLATQAMKGAAALQQQTQQSPNALRNAITSPEGATLAGLRKLNSLKMKESWQAVMQASIQRLREMDAQRTSEANETR